MNSHSNLKPSVFYATVLSLMLIHATQPAVAGSDPCASTTPQGEIKQTYCDAATAEKKAATAEKVTAGVYAAAGAVCGVACFAENTGFGTAARAGCTIGSVAAAGADFVATKNFTGAISALYSAYTGWDSVKAAYKNLTAGGAKAAAAHSPEQLAASSKAGVAPGVADEAATAAKQGEKDSSSCISAILNVGTAGMKIYSANQASDAAEKNLESAAKVTSQSQSYGFSPSSSGTGGAGSASAATANPAGTAAGLSSSDKMIAAHGACASASQTGSLPAAVACAAATGATLPPIAKDPRFGQMIQEATGMDPSEFMKKAMNEGPGKAAGQGVVQGAGLQGDAAIKTAAAFLAAERTGYEGNSGGYAGGGGGRRGAGGGDGNDMNQMMQGLMAQFAPKTAEAEKDKSGVLKFGKNGERYPASVAEDRRVSLFDRVTNRYRVVVERASSSLR